MQEKGRKIPLKLAVCVGTLLLLTGCGSQNTRLAEGMELIETLDYQTALTVFDEAEAQQEDARLIARGRGIAYMGLTDYEQAIVWLKQALSQGSGLVQSVDFDMNYYLAAAYTKNGQPKEAKNTYTAILSLRPKEKDAYFLRGCAELALSDVSGAQADFDKVLSLAPGDYDRLIKIYEALESYGCEDIGKVYLQNALEKADDMDAYDIGRIYFYLGEYQKAYMALEEARQKGEPESYLYLGRAYEATGDYNYASSVYNSYLNSNSGNAEIYNQLGLCELAKKEYQKALEAFQAGLALEDGRLKQQLAFNEIVAYEYLGEYPTAASLLEKYRESYPDDEEAKREQQFLSTR